jgi:hypothetical protein
VEIASTAGKRQSKRCFFEKRTKKRLQIQAEPPRKYRSQLSKSFLLLFFKKEDLPVFLPAKKWRPRGAAKFREETSKKTARPQRRRRYLHYSEPSFEASKNAASQ